MKAEQLAHLNAHKDGAEMDDSGSAPDSGAYKSDSESRMGAIAEAGREQKRTMFLTNLFSVL